jgi:hypothetical protein
MEKWKKKVLEGARNIMENKKKAGQENDLPTWQEALAQIARWKASRPDLPVYYE